MNLPDASTGALRCPHCGASSTSWLPIEPFWDGRELRKIVGWSNSRWTGFWNETFPKFYQRKRIAGSTLSRLVRVFPASQVKSFMDSGVWLKPTYRKRAKGA